MTRKLLLSVAASALLTTSVFAGDLTTDQGHAKISTESYMQNGMDIIDFRSLVYTARIQRDLGGGTILSSISDPSIEIDVSKIEFAYHISDTGTLAQGFDEKGKGMTPAEIRPFLNGQDDQVKTLLEDDYFTGSSLQDADGGSNPIAFTQINFEGDAVYAQYDGSSSDSVQNGHAYKLLHNDFMMPFKYPRDNASIEVRLFSSTLDNSFIDSAEFNPTTEFVPQFKVSCVRKFDGLINFENDRISFVNPAHGEKISYGDSTTSGNNGDNDPSIIDTSSVINNDRMVFSIENARTNVNDNTRWMSGALSEFRFQETNQDNNFSNPADWNVTADEFAGTNANKLDTLLSPDHSYSLVGNTPFVEDNPADRTPGIEFDNTTKIFTITHADSAIAAGTTNYEVNFRKLATNTPIRPVQFESVSIDLEGGRAANDEKDRADGTGADRILVMSVGGNQPISYDHNLSALGSHYVINNVDDNTTVITPQVEGSATMGQDVGEWKDHAYIAQIAGASSTQAGMETKLFIVNRSCSTVTPQIEIIKDGVKLPLTGVASIDPDNQGFYNLNDLLEAMTPDVTAGSDYARYAIEVTLPGVAEDFYMYAQVKNSAINQFKDLPVYNTSNRD